MYHINTAKGRCRAGSQSNGTWVQVARKFCALIIFQWTCVYCPVCFVFVLTIVVILPQWDVLLANSFLLMYACGFWSWQCVKSSLNGAGHVEVVHCLWSLLLKGTFTPWWSERMIGMIAQDADSITTLTVVLRSINIDLSPLWNYHDTPQEYGKHQGSLFARSHLQATCLHSPKTMNIINMRSNHINIYNAIEILRTAMTSDPHIHRSTTSHQLSNPVKASKHRISVPYKTHPTACSLTSTSSPVLHTHTAGLSTFFTPPLCCPMYSWHPLQALSCCSWMWWRGLDQSILDIGVVTFWLCGPRLRQCCLSLLMQMYCIWRVNVNQHTWNWEDVGDMEWRKKGRMYTGWKAGVLTGHMWSTSSIVCLWHLNAYFWSWTSGLGSKYSTSIQPLTEPIT